MGAYDTKIEAAKRRDSKNNEKFVKAWFRAKNKSYSKRSRARRYLYIFFNDFTHHYGYQFVISHFFSPSEKNYVQYSYAAMRCSNVSSRRNISIIDIM